MSERDVSILFVGDMHLGRLPSRVPTDAAATTLPPLAELGPGAAWLLAADEAVRRGVDAVALAGDILHGANDLFEGSHELDAGLDRLERGNIPVIAVAGNHDTRALPQLALRRGIHLLGAGGTWGAFPIEPEHGPRVRIVGWSFPEPRWMRSPLDQTPPSPESGVVTLGLLHCDLEAADSHYAPVSRTALAAARYDGWFLGHIHRPDPVPKDGAPFYLGSLSGLDPTETGRHGPVLVTVTSAGAVAGRRLALAPLRWHEQSINIDPHDQPAAEMPMIFHAALETAAAELDGDLGDARAVGVRLTLTGSAKEPAAVRKAADAVVAEGRARLAIGGIVFFVEKTICDIRARRDFAALARHPDPAGLLARRILVLEGASEVPGVDNAAGARALLVAEARRRMLLVDGNAAFSPLDEPGCDEFVRFELLATVRGLLEHVLTTRGERHASDQT